MIVMDFETPHGAARAQVHPVAGARGALILGHGAGGGVEAPDLAAATRAAHMVGVSVALVEQPYRVAGRRSPPRAPTLDAAWISVIEQLAAKKLAGLALAVGGRSSGARVACRTAGATGALGVLCLAFPLVSPSGVSRQDELDATGVPTLVVQGASDRFGMPESTDTRSVVVVKGDHGLKSDLPGIGVAVAGWLRQVLSL